MRVVSTPPLLQVELWDTGNMEHAGLQNMRSSTYWHDNQAVILVYDSGDKETLTELNRWIPLARDYSKDQDVLFSLWGNDTGNTINPVDEESVRNFAATFGISPSLVFSVTATTGDNLLDSYKRLVDAVHLMNTNQARAYEVLRDSEDRIQLRVPTHAQPRQRTRWKEWCCGAM